MFVLQLLLACKAPVVVEEVVISAHDINHDYDGDGWSEADGDCNDVNSAINPDADEICDQVDNDCDGRVDDNTIDGIGWYLDIDGDGFGREEYLITDCTASPGYVRVQTDEQGIILFDCDDNNPMIYPTADEVCDNKDNDCDGYFDDQDPSFVGDAYWYRDSDQDGFGIAEIQMRQCSQPAGFVQGPEQLPLELQDCDDLNPAVNPDMLEICDGFDNDCDGRIDDDDPNGMIERIWTIDADGDGFGDARFGADIVYSCDDVDGYVENTEDCDDTDPNIYPDAEEICDGLDQNCDGLVDEDVQIVFYADVDGDGYGADPNHMAPESGCENTPPEGYVSNADDCDDANALANPSLSEVCNDGIDNNCDGLIDDDTAIDVSAWYFDADLDGYGDINEQILACTAPPYHVSNSDDCDDNDSARNPGEIEICSLNPVNFQHRDEDCSGNDNDPDPNLQVASGGTYFYYDHDQDGFGNSNDSIFACYAEGLYTATQGGDCGDYNADINPGAVEICGGPGDEDCDGQDDETGAEGCEFYFYDYDGDTFGVSSQSECYCTASGNYQALFGGDCNDYNSTIHPDAGNCGLFGSVSDSDAAFVISGREEEASTRRDIIGGFDYNADGFPDIAVVDPGYDAPLNGIQIDSGALFLYLGPVSGDKNVNVESDADLIFSVVGAYEEMGLHGISVGNWDSDPEDEIAVNGALDAFLIQSGLEGQGIIDDLNPYVSRLPNRSGGGLDATQSVGDINGDGLLDVVSNYDQLFYGVETIAGNGIDTFIYSGSEMFCSSPTLRNIGADIDGDGINEWVGVDDNDVSIRKFSSSSGMSEIAVIAGIVHRHHGRVEQGDFNGDGYIDIAASNYAYNYYVQGAHISSSGAGYVFNGSNSGITATQYTDAEWGIRGENAQDMVASQLVSIDFDGDGFDDLLSVSRESGYANLFYGPLSFPLNSYGLPRMALPSDGDLNFTGMDSGAANVGDQNQDGAEDLLIREGGTNGTDIFLFYGALNF